MTGSDHRNPADRRQDRADWRANQAEDGLLTVAPRRLRTAPA